MRVGTLLVVACLLVGGGALIGCSASDADDVVRIGYTGPLSGGAALYGRNALGGIRMAVDEINAAGGIEVEGRMLPVEVVSLDDRYLPNETATNARRLLQREGVRVIFVPHAGGILALQGMNDRDPAFLIMAYSSDPIVIESGNPLTVMIPTRYDGYASVFVERMMGRFGLRLGLLTTTTAYGRAWAEMAAAEWRRQGGQVFRNHGVDYNTTTDFSGAVSRTLADDPDVIVVGGPSQPTGLVIRSAREQGYRGGFLMLDQAKFEEVLEVVSMADLEGTIGVHPMESYPGPGVPAFVERYRARTGESGPLVSEFAQSYQATHAVARAMELAGTAADPRAIRERMDEAVRDLGELQTLVRFESVDASGFIAREVYAADVVDGGFVPILISSPGS